MTDVPVSDKKDKTVGAAHPRKPFKKGLTPNFIIGNGWVMHEN